MFASTTLWLDEVRRLPLISTPPAFPSTRLCTTRVRCAFGPSTIPIPAVCTTTLFEMRVRSAEPTKMPGAESPRREARVHDWMRLPSTTTSCEPARRTQAVLRSR